MVDEGNLPFHPIRLPITNILIHFGRYVPDMMRLAFHSPLKATADVHAVQKHKGGSGFQLAAAGLAIAAGLTFGPLAPLTSVRAAPAAKSDSTVAVSGSALRSHFFFVPGTSTGYYQNVVRQVNLPVELRTAPSSSPPVVIGDARVPVYSNLFVLTLSAGQSLFYKNFIAAFGVEGELGVPTKSSRLVEAEGAYYSSMPGFRSFRIMKNPGGSITFNPCVFAELGKGAEKVYAGIGYKLYWDQITAVNGTHTVHTEYYPDIHEVQDYSAKKYDLMRLLVGEPYAYLGIPLGPRNPESKDLNAPLRPKVYVGLRHVISTRSTDLGRQAEFIFRTPALVVGASMQYQF